jgi:nucleoside-diphosphate-sugar epimerase
VFSFVHVEDAALAAVQALGGPAGVYNVVDDEPVTFGEWLPEFAGLIGAPRPLRVPTWLGRLGAGAYGVHLLTRQRGASNAAARERLEWEPRYPTWRKGFQSLEPSLPRSPR